MAPRSFPKRLSASFSSHSRSSSFSSHSDECKSSSRSDHALEPPVLVYHESARSIVFRDHLRRAVKRSEASKSDVSPLNSPKKNNGSNDDTGKIGRMNLNEVHATATTETEAGTSRDVAATVALEKNSSNVAVVPSSTDDVADSGTCVPTQIGGMLSLKPKVTPLPSFEFGPNDTYDVLLDDLSNIESGHQVFTEAEQEVVRLFEEQQCAVKTIKNSDWTAFINRFQVPEKMSKKHPTEHDDIPPGNTINHTFNSFVTSTTLLPKNGRKMRCFGSIGQYTVGVVFSLPTIFDDGQTENEATIQAKTWSWPAGYCAKTEFNIDNHGCLINGRKEALVSLSTLRKHNEDYLNKTSYFIGKGIIKNANYRQIPYNEVFLRVGGCGRLVNGKDCLASSKTEEKHQNDNVRRSYNRGVGLPVALFVRSTTYGDLIQLLRTRARLQNVLGDKHFKGIPLLIITPDHGVRVLTEALQRNLWKIAAQSLNPFQNHAIAYKTTIHNTCEISFQQKVEELIDLDENIRETLTPEELGRLAGGFGATDESVAAVLKEAVIRDHKLNKNKDGNDGDNNTSKKSSTQLQDVVNEGLASAIRAGDYHTSRQLLILYSLVASQVDQPDSDDNGDGNSRDTKGDDGSSTNRPQKENGERFMCDNSSNHSSRQLVRRQSSLGRDLEKDMEMIKAANGDRESLSRRLPPPPPPPPLDTDRLRSATNSDGLLAVLGAAQVLKAMQDGSAKLRVQESVKAVDEWVSHGKQSVAFRVSSWYDQRAAQDNLKINMESNSNFMAFVSNKAISNRRAFAQLLRSAIDSTDFTDVSFLRAVHQLLSKMNSPCLRLELLQYVLGLDNRYSIAHVARSVELAATCLDISSYGRMATTTLIES